MKLSVLLQTSDYRGDHAADIAVAYDVLPGETVEALAARLLGDDGRSFKHGDRIEIRRVSATPDAGGERRGP